MADGQEDREAVGEIKHAFPDGRFLMEWDERGLAKQHQTSAGSQLVLTTADRVSVHVRVVEITHHDGNISLVRVEPLKFQGSVRLVVKPAAANA